MPIVGERKATSTFGTSYVDSPITPLAESFNKLTKDIRQSNTGCDLFLNPALTVMDPACKETLREFFVKDTWDPADPQFCMKGTNTPNARAIEDHKNMMNECFINDCEGINENAASAIGNYNPVIGMTFPMHKYIMMNTIWDKGGIPKMVARTPKWTESAQIPFIQDPEGNKYDMFQNQHMIKKAMDATAPFVEYEVSLPENQSTDFLDSDHLGHPTGNISIASYISAVKVNNKWYPVEYRFTPTYGNQKVRIINKDVSIKETTKDDKTGKITTTEYKDTIAATMIENKFQIMAIKQGTVVTAVKLKLKIDTSDAMQKTPTVFWENDTRFYEMPEANPINVTVTPEIIKDNSALYNINHLSVIMNMIKMVLENNKDDIIKADLDNDFEVMEPWQKTYHQFDFAPRTNYAADHVTWRHATFLDALDTYVTELASIWRDPNITVAIYGRPDLIRKITPVEHVYTAPSSIGPINLDFQKTVCTSDNRVYNFVSSMKLNGTDQLIILINPRNTDRFIYRIYDYQLYVSNEIRNAQNPTLPAIHAFERFGFYKYMPVQGRLDILNASGYREADTDAWGNHSDNAGYNENNGYARENAARQAILNNPDATTTPPTTPTPNPGTGTDPLPPVGGDTGDSSNP